LIITQDISRILRVLTEKKGSVIAYPTETVYGLGSRISDHDGIERIIRIKGRDAAKGMIVLASSIEEVRTLASLDHKQAALLERFWPGPLSVVLPALAGLHPLLSPEGRVAVRITPHNLARDLVLRAGPITSTSANLSGMPPACTAREVTDAGLDIDAVLDGGNIPGGSPSTLIDLTVWPPVCLRPGVIPFETILKAL